MPAEETLAPLLAALRDLICWLDSTGAPKVLIGGVAASLIGRPRFTRDIDALVLLEEERWEGLLESGKRFQFAPRRRDVLAFAKETRVLVMRHAPTEIDVDVIFGLLPFERETVGRAIMIELGGVHIPVPTPEDLIIMKAVAQRPRDIADIESIVELHPKLDRRRIRRWVRRFAIAIDHPEILKDLEKILKKRR